MLKAGFVLVANCPTNGATPLPMALPGLLLLIDRFGKLSDTLALPGFIEGPLDFTVQDKGIFVKVFISNVLTGTVSRLDLSVAGGKFLVLRKALVASGYIHRSDAVTFEVGPTGFGLRCATRNPLCCLHRRQRSILPFRMPEIGLLRCQMVRVKAQSSTRITSTCTGTRDGAIAQWALAGQQQRRH